VKKSIFFSTILIILNGCAQHTALLGPSYTIATTGNVYQAALNYQTNSLIKRNTGKSTFEHISTLVEKEEKKINLDPSFIALVESNIRNTRRILSLKNNSSN
jgi:hypothetical protein